MDNTENILCKKFAVVKKSWCKLSIVLKHDTIYQSGVVKIFDHNKKNIIFPTFKLPDIIFTKNNSAESIEEMDKYRTFDVYINTLNNALINVYTLNLDIQDMKLTKVKESVVKKKAGIWRLRKLFSLSHLKYYLDNLHKDYKNKQFLDRFSSDYILLQNPNYFDKYISKLNLRKFKNIPTVSNMMYLVDSSIQYEINKDTVKTHDILKSMNTADKGTKIYCITKYGFPYDRDKSISNKRVSDVLDGVTYLKLVNKDDNYNTNCIISYMEKYISAVISMCVRMNITTIRASTSYINGVAGLYAAKYLGIRSVFEVRGFTEDFTIQNRPELFGTDLLRMRTNLENLIFSNVDEIYAMDIDIVNDLKDRGVDINKIYMLSDDNIPTPLYKEDLDDTDVVNDVVNDDVILAPDDDNKIRLLKRYNLDEIDLIIGYAGPLTKISEWKDTLNMLTNIARKNHFVYRFVFIGGESDKNMLISTVKTPYNIIFINDSDIDNNKKCRLYDMLDIFICAEGSTGLEDTIHKAMLMEKLVIVKGNNMATIVDHKNTGLIYSTEEDLDNCLSLNMADRLKIATNGRRYILKNP